jgi:hypothetical protein
VLFALAGGLIAGPGLWACQQDDQPAVVVSDDPSEVRNPREIELLLRPNVEQAFYLFVRNPAGTEKKFTVHLKTDGTERASAEVTVGAGESKRLSFAKPAPPAPAPAAADQKPAPPPAYELSGLPYRLRFTIQEAGKSGEPTTQDLPLRIQVPDRYVDPPRASWDGPAARFAAEVQAKRQFFSGPPAPVKLAIMPDRIPGFIPGHWRDAVLQDVLSPQAPSVRLSATPFRFDGVPSQDGLVYVTVDDYDRAFAFRTNFPPDRQVEPVAVTDARVGLVVPRYARPGPVVIGLEVDNVPMQDYSRIVAELGIDLNGDGKFTPNEITEYRGARQQQVSLTPAAADGAIVLKTAVHDWSQSRNMAGVYGHRAIRARLLDTDRRPMARDALAEVIFDDTPPEPDSIKFARVEPRIIRGSDLWLSATANDPESGIKDVVFFLGKPPADNTLPPKTEVYRGVATQDGTTTWWKAKVPLPNDKGPVVISAQFTNNVGMSTFGALPPVELVDPAMGAAAATTGIIKGVVVQGERPQPAHAVTLRAAATPREVKETATTNDEGQFIFKDVPPGNYVVASVKNGDPLTRGEVSVTAEKGVTKEVTVALHRGR